MTQSVERAAAETEARRMHALLRTIEAQRAVHAARDRSEVIQVVADHALQVFPHAGSAVVEVLEGDCLRYAATSGTLVQVHGISVPVQGSLSGYSLTSRQPLLCDDSEVDPRVDLQACRRTGIRSMCVVPLISGDGDQVFGVLKVAAGSPYAFDEEDRLQLEVLAESLRAGLKHTEAFEALAEASRFKSDLIGMLGHEVGTPLTSIVGFAELAIGMLDDPRAVIRVREALTRVTRNATRLKDVVGEILTLVTAEAGRIRAVPEEVVLCSRLAEAAELQTTLPVVDCPGDLSALVQPGHLDQIMANLLTNAAKYGGGATRIAARRVEDEHVEIAVEDSGDGVPDDLVDELFQRFARGAGTSRSADGTGLGLWIVRELARANGGEVAYRPNPGGGACFAVTLPEG